MLKFRVYRLPGSQRVWHIDTGVNTVVVNAVAFMSDVSVKTMSGPGETQPRFWIEVEGNLFVDKNGVAKFMYDTATLIPEELQKIILNGQNEGTLRVMDAAEKLVEQMSEEDLEKLTRPEGVQ